MDRSIGFEKNCELTFINVQYIDIVNRVVVGHREMRWMKGELSELRLEIEKFTVFDRRVFPPH